MDTNDLILAPGSLAHERVLVTGGGSGLGREIAEALLLLGAEVYICGRRGALLDDTAAALRQRHGGSITAIACDIREEVGIERMMDEIWERGPLTGLVNNAAGNFQSRTETLSANGFDAITSIVLRGGFLVTQACGKRWIASGDPGSVVSVLASWIHGGVPYTVPSAMSKAAMQMMTRSLAVEWGPKGIRLNTVAPGSFPTAGVNAHLSSGEAMPVAGSPREENPIGRHGRMAELANPVAFLLSRGASYITGETITIDGGEHLLTMGGLTRKDWSDADWAAERERVRKHDAEDRARRTA